MLRFTKESDLERVQRLRKSILEGYIEDETATDLLVSEADLKFLLFKAEEQVGFEVESSTPNQDNNSDIQPIPTEMQKTNFNPDNMMNRNHDDDPF